MPRTTLAGRNRLRLMLCGFFVALAVPTAFLVYHAYGQLKWEAFYQHRVQAEELAARVDSRLAEIAEREEARAFTDYEFIVVQGDQSANFLQRSPLAALPPSAGIPGLVGHFQVEPGGQFSTPLLPRGHFDPRVLGVSAGEQAQRASVQTDILEILNENRLVSTQQVLAKDAGRAAGKAVVAAPSDTLRDDVSRDESAQQERAGERSASNTGQEAFDLLESVSRQQSDELAAKSDRSVVQLKLDSSYSARARERDAGGAEQESEETVAKRPSRKERSAVPAPEPVAPPGALRSAIPQQSTVSLQTFESDIDPFEVGLLSSGHFVLFRKVTRDSKRYIQGALVRQDELLRDVVEVDFRRTALSAMSDLAVAYQGNVVSTYLGRTETRYPAESATLSGALLYRARLSAPFDNLELIASVTRLPAGPGARVVAWTASILALVLCAGFYSMYRAGSRQIEVAAQQQDFVSAVSHELKTPLTSIRMYAEMLRDGMAPEAKKASYYNYITLESERLSRLIENVLQLARMSRNDIDIELKPISAAQLTDSIRSTVSAPIERAGFSLALDCPEHLRPALLQVDSDCFSQIIINLVDNALKFSSGSSEKRVDIGWFSAADTGIRLTVRDYGPGVRKDQLRKIFRLFYRAENELTRETVGTGIGLALVQQLARAMHATVQVANREPGAEFSVTFARHSLDSAG